jgi:hypothetical protein
MTPEEYKKLVFKRKARKKVIKLPKELKEYGVEPLEARQQIKPLSVNDAWQGRRFKTNEYKVYERAVFYNLPKVKIPKPPYLIHYEFGFSNAGSDYDNALKPLQDILQKRYKFNDNDIWRAIIDKKKVKKGEEYFKVRLENYGKKIN